MEQAKPVTPGEVLYIKLGGSGEFEAECISGGKLRLGFRKATHQACKEGGWQQVQQELEANTKSKGAATRSVNQIRKFYESGPDVLWVTFYKNELWWCFSQPGVQLRPDKRKERTATGGWKNKSLGGKPLLLSEMSGALLAMRGFRGTICQVREKEYVLAKINDAQSPAIGEAEDALQALEQKIEALLPTLTPLDSEMLIDFIFRAAGWQRTSDLGKAMPDLDMELLAPITNERCGVQVKTGCKLKEFESYRDDKLKDMQGFARFYFTALVPDKSLKDAATRLQQISGVDEEAGAPKIELLLPPDIARLCVRHGLSRWVIDKAR